MRRVIRKPRVTAGLKCPPEMCPSAVTMIARMRPCAMATPSRSPPAVMIDPAPTKMSANAPMNSAIDLRRTSPSTGRRLVARPDGKSRPQKSFLAPAPLRLVVDADDVRDPVDVVEVGGDLQGVVDRRVAPAGGA